jgi:hypothetical protein
MLGVGHNTTRPGGTGPCLLFLFLKSKELLGNDLLSQEATPQVPSALTSLTAGFEMGPGVSSSLLSPKSSCVLHFCSSVLTNLRVRISNRLASISANLSLSSKEALGR